MRLCLLLPLLTTSFITTQLWSATVSTLPRTVAQGATIEEAYTGEPFFEGPTWDPVSHALLFTSCRAEEILRLDASGEVTVWNTHNGGINGSTLSNDGRLLGAAVVSHQVVSIGLTPNGPADVRVLAENASWNQPNDVCQSPSGHIYFSDPSWADVSLSAVYHLAPDGTVTKVITDMAIPNGVITSLDGRTLYVGDSNRKHWRAWPINEDGSLGEGRIFFDPETENQDDPDGMALDEEGNLYFAGRGGVWVVTPEGESLGLIPTPGFCSNIGFGDDDGRTLYFTGPGKVWRLRMNVRGADFARRSE